MKATSTRRPARPQSALYYDAVRHATEVHLLFLELVKAGLTRDELATNIRRRPALWQRFETWLDHLPPPPQNDFRKRMDLDNMNQAAQNRHADALCIQEGACNLGGVARSLVRAINQCRDESAGTLNVREDPAIRLIVHQMAFLCNVEAIDHTPDVYGSLMKACEEKDAARKAGLRALQQTEPPTGE